MVNKKYGRHTLYVGSSMHALSTPEATYRTKVARGFLAATADGKKSLDIPFLGVVH